MSKQRALLATIAGVLAWDPAALGAETPGDADGARPCRPTVSCTADLAAPGALEVEAGGFASVVAGGGRSFALPFLLKQTFTKLFQLQAGSNGYSRVEGGPTAPASTFFDNVVLGGKLHFFDQGRALPSLALTALASLPVSSGGHDGAIVTGHASKDLGPLHVDYNLGVNAAWGATGVAAASQPFTALALSVSPLPPFGLAVEGWIEAAALPYASRDGGVRACVTSTARPWLVLDFGGDAGFFPSTRAYSVFAGVTVIPVVFWRPAA